MNTPLSIFLEERSRLRQSKKIATDVIESSFAGRTFRWNGQEWELKSIDGSPCKFIPAKTFENDILFNLTSQLEKAENDI